MPTKLQLKCLRCGHEWLRRNLKKLPGNCPNKKCNSPYWNRPRTLAESTRRTQARITNYDNLGRDLRQECDRLRDALVWIETESIDFKASLKAKQALAKIRNHQCRE